ncbi:mucin-2-like [Phyllobates terribilis]|uniref:mucin-2-like n=1 Tax=Phyllobates terribilis TaxID=111132 RepID=UPI003CCAD491
MLIKVKCSCFNCLIFDDVSSNECILVEECPCSYNSNIYEQGEYYSTSCRICSCYSGKWNCTAIPCSATCSIEGGSHITTFDQLQYHMQGDCEYVISKDCKTSLYAILGNIRQCGLRQTEVCLTSVTIVLNNEMTRLDIANSGQVFVNGMISTLPVHSGTAWHWH